MDLHQWLDVKERSERRVCWSLVGILFLCVLVLLFLGCAWGETAIWEPGGGRYPMWSIP
jgi:hypothetical protein